VAEQPAGTVTLLFTDIEGSTRLLDELGADSYRDALGEHRRLLRAAFDRHGGYEVDYEGDAFFVAFSSAADGLAAAKEAQAALAPGPIRVRMGLHTGEPQLDPPKYVGIDVHRAARIMSAGHGGQVLVSESTAGLAGTEFALRDLGPHRLKDLTAAERLFQLGEGEFPPLKSLRQTNLPVQATPLVGREREVAELVEHLRAPDTRLLTLTGVGGTGKTRLALQSAAELSEDFRDGVWFVDLAPLRDPELVEPTIAVAVGADDLIEHLRSKQTLLVLDNFEQVVDAAGVVSGLVSGSPASRLLVTSRIALRIAGERLYPVSPLSREEAVELFTERARRVKPELALNGVVGEICDRLDRLPLAIELAAARVRVLTPPAMLARLEQRLPLLIGGARDLPTRQQTLEAAIAWSYELLEPGQQRLFAELGAFNGGRAFEAIEAVCNPAGELDVLTAVEALCDGSLLHQQEDVDGEVRFVMLETIHEYARARLADLPDADVVSERHALHFHALAVEGGPKLQSAEGGIWRKRFEAEIDNLRLALDWLEAAGESELELAMGARLSNFWRGWGLIKEGRARLEGMLARASSEPSVVLCRALVALASLYDHLGEREESLEMDRRALAVAEETGDDELVAFVLNNLGLCLLTLGDHETGTAKLEECVAIGRRIGDRDITLNALGNLAWEAITVGNWEDARSRCREVIDLARDAGADYGLAGAYCNLGWVLLHLREPEAEPQFLASLELARHYGPREAGECLSGLSAVAAATGRDEEAAKLAGLVDAILAEEGVSPEPFVGDVNERTAASLRATLGDAEFERLHAEGAALDPAATISALLEN
jgi:predicted ATPase/class 3 adenylate cyclase